MTTKTHPKRTLEQWVKKYWWTIDWSGYDIEGDLSTKYRPDEVTNLERAYQEYCENYDNPKPLSFVVLDVAEELRKEDEWLAAHPGQTLEQYYGSESK